MILNKFPLDLDTLKAAHTSSTDVVEWGHSYYTGKVRGPFGRWFQVNDVELPYRKHVADPSDDARFAALAMNMAPALIEEIEKLRKYISELETTLEVENTLLGKT